MASSIKDSGTWKDIDKIYIKDSGSWKLAKLGYVNDSGTWKEFYDCCEETSGYTYNTSTGLCEKTGNSDSNSITANSKTDHFFSSKLAYVSGGTGIQLTMCNYGPWGSCGWGCAGKPCASNGGCCGSYNNSGWNVGYDEAVFGTFTWTDYSNIQSAMSSAGKSLDDVIINYSGMCGNTSGSTTQGYFWDHVCGDGGAQNPSLTIYLTVPSLTQTYTPS